MATAGKRKTGKRPRVLTKPHEEILKAIHFYRYMTALDVMHLLYSPKSITYVRDMLSELSGGEDFKTNEYLYRFLIPSTRGNTERIYTLGSRGRDFLLNELGMVVDWYYRPDKVKHASYSQVTHSLLLTRFLVSAQSWCKEHPDFNLAQTRISYEFAKTSLTVDVGYAGQKETLNVIPDGWLLFEKLKDGTHEHWYPILLEIDRGSEYQRKFKQHVLGRMEFIRSGAYAKVFGTKAVIIAYATTGDRAAYRETRRRTMCAWTKEVLEETHREKWASVFRFHALALEEIYNPDIFAKAVWYRPDMSEPVSLFA